MSDRTKKLAFNFTHVLFNCLFGNLFVSSQDLEVICGHLVDAKFRPTHHPGHERAIARPSGSSFPALPPRQPAVADDTQLPILARRCHRHCRTSCWPRSQQPTGPKRCASASPRDPVSP